MWSNIDKCGLLFHIFPLLFAKVDNRFGERQKEEYTGGQDTDRGEVEMLMQAKQAARKNKKKKKASEPRHITRAVTHIRLQEANAVKLAALDELASVYLALCQQYVRLFCTEELPNKLRDPLYKTELSERWQRVAIMQAAGIAKSWRSNRANAVRDCEKEQEQWVNFYNTTRPHESLDYRSPDQYAKAQQLDSVPKITLF